MVVKVLLPLLALGSCLVSFFRYLAASPEVAAQAESDKTQRRTLPAPALVAVGRALPQNEMAAQ